MSDHASWDELAAGYAVNALEPEDEHAFTAHLRGCDRCRATLASLEEVTAHLAYAAEPAEPPADLGRRILDAAAAERPAVFGKTPPAHVTRPARPRAPKVWKPAFRAATLATAAALLVVLGLGMWTMSLRQDNAAQQAAISRRTQALSCLAAPENRTYRLAEGSGPRATTCLAGDRAYVVADGLERNDAADSNYVLWWLDAERTPHAVERFDVEADGTAVFELPFDGEPVDVTAMAISLEPGSALPAQPTRIVASGTAT